MGATIRRAAGRVPAYVWALAGLALFSVAAVPASVGSTALLSMFPFAAILAIAAVGQTLVIQQRGIDLSVPGAISLAALVVTRSAAGGHVLAVAVVLALLAAFALGVVNGLLVSLVGITPLVATLAVNALALGVVQAASGGVGTAAPASLSRFALDKTAGVPNTVLVAVAFVLAGWFVTNRTVAGRRFVASGAAPDAARVAGVRVARHVLAAYVACGVFSGLAGVLLAGYLQTPGTRIGDTYLLSTIAAVVLGGTALSGGRGSVVGTAAGALFLTQLVQVVLTMGAPSSVQYLVQSGAIAAVVLLRACAQLPFVARVGALLRRGAPAAR